MEFYQLRSFATVAEVGHLTRAAERLHISQPALSAQIRALEEELGVTLFERTSTGMTLTSAGARLLDHAGRVLAAVDDLRAEAKSLQGTVSGRVRVGTVSDPGFIRVGSVLALAVERYPLLEIELDQHVSGEAFEHVRDGKLDASFYFGDAKDPRVAALALGPMVYRVVAPAAWRARVEKADWAEIAALPWILTPSISTHNQLIRRLFDAHGVEATKVVEADQESVISTLVVSGIGVSLMREDLAAQKAAEGEVCLWKDVRLVTTLWFIYPANRDGDPTIRALLDLVREIWNLPRAEGVAPPRRARGA